jgi:hypothetical protein
MKRSTSVTGEWSLRFAVALPLAYEVYRLLRGTFSSVLTSGQGVGYYIGNGVLEWGIPAVFAAAVVLLLLGSRARAAWIVILLCSCGILVHDLYYYVSGWRDGDPLYVPLSLVLDVSLIMVAFWSYGRSSAGWKRQHRTSAST